MNQQPLSYIPSFNASAGHTASGGAYHYSNRSFYYQNTNGSTYYANPSASTSSYQQVGASSARQDESDAENEVEYNNEARICIGYAQADSDNESTDSNQFTNAQGVESDSSDNESDYNAGYASPDISSESDTPNDASDDYFDQNDGGQSDGADDDDADGDFDDYD